MHIVSKFQASMVWELPSFEDIFTKDHWLTELINYKGGFKTAPATLGHLITGKVLRKYMESKKKVLWMYQKRSRKELGKKPKKYYESTGKVEEGKGK